MVTCVHVTVTVMLLYFTVSPLLYWRVILGNALRYKLKIYYCHLIHKVGVIMFTYKRIKSYIDNCFHLLS